MTTIINSNYKLLNYIIFLILCVECVFHVYVYILHKRSNIFHKIVFFIIIINSVFLFILSLIYLYLVCLSIFKIFYYFLYFLNFYNVFI